MAMILTGIRTYRVEKRTQLDAAAEALGACSHCDSGADPDFCARHRAHHNSAQGMGQLMPSTWGDPTQGPQ